MNELSDIKELEDYKLIAKFASGQAGQQARIFLAVLCVGSLSLLLIPGFQKVYSLIPTAFFAAVFLFAGWSKLQKMAQAAMFAIQNGTQSPVKVSLVRLASIDDPQEIEVLLSTGEKWHIVLTAGELGARMLEPNQAILGTGYFAESEKSEIQNGQSCNLKVIRLNDRLIWKFASLKKLS